MKHKHELVLSTPFPCKDQCISSNSYYIEWNLAGAFEQEVETKLSCRLRSIVDGKDPSNHVQEADKFIKDDVVKKFLTSR
jgi:hypothetical protein